MNMENSNRIWNILNYQKLKYLLLSSKKPRSNRKGKAIFRKLLKKTKKTK